MADETPTSNAPHGDAPKPDGWTVRIPKPSGDAVRRALWWIGIGAFAGLQFHMLAKIEGWKVPAGGISCNGCKPSPTPAPDPGPKPEPPAPAPIPAEGFRVLVVYESADLSSLPPAQLADLYSADVRAYLNAHCVKVGGVPEWRIWDKDVDASAESKVWHDALKKAAGKPLPCVLISDGKTGFEGALPKSGLLDLLKKYGGN